MKRLDFRYWWRRRELNPRPETLRNRFYMCSLFIILGDTKPNRQGKHRHSLTSLTTASRHHNGDLMCITSVTQPISELRPRTQALSGESEVFVVCDYILTNGFTRYLTPSTCPSNLTIPVEASTPPRTAKAEVVLF